MSLRSAALEAASRPSSGQHDIERTGQCSRFEPLGWLQAYYHALTLARIADLVQHEIACILGFALHIHLRDEARPAWCGNCKVYVRRAAWIRHRPDRAEGIAPVR